MGAKDLWDLVIVSSYSEEETQTNQGVLEREKTRGEGSR